MNAIASRFRSVAGPWAACLAVMLVLWSSPRVGHAQAGPDAYAAGVPWTGEAPVVETVEQVMARDRGPTPREGSKPARRWPAWLANMPQDPLSPGTASWPVLPDGEVVLETPQSPQTVGTSFRAAGLTESGFFPPDTMGDVSPTQVLITLNGRIKVFSRAGAVGALNTTLDNFFASVRAGSGTSDPQVRFDRLSGRWFVMCINVASTSNRVLIAVSSGATITGTASFSFYQFQFDTVGSTPNADTGRFLDYPSLGVDANALYIGGNVFQGTFSHASLYVVRKSSVTGGGPIVVTPFRDPGDIRSPRGVDSDDASGTQGYFIGVSGSFFGRLVFFRVTTPGATPAISSPINITVPSTAFPQAPTPPGSSLPISVTDDRLFAAGLFQRAPLGTRTLWTTHSIEVNSSGVASSSGNRDGARWYQLSNLTSGTPTVTQSGTLFDSSPTNPKFYIFPSVAMSGQGHMALGATYCGNADRLGIAFAGRLASDPSGSIQSPTFAIVSTANYDDGAQNGQFRWGDYSLTRVDPSDGMSIWTFQEYCDVTSGWAVRAMQLRALAPATPSSCSPASLTQGATAVNVTLTGTSVGGTTFFDPDPSFPNHITVTVNGGGVTVNSATLTADTQLQVNMTVDPGAATGARTITVTNPDGQQATSISGILTINPGNTCPTFSQHPNHQAPCAGGSAIFSAQATGVPAPTLQWTRNGDPIPGATSTTLAISPVGPADAGTYRCTATNACGSTSSNEATLSLTPPPVFASHPTDVTACAGNPVSFSVMVTSPAGVTYQWRRNGAPIGGATSNTLDLAGVAPSQAGSYDCIATGPCGSTTSNAAMLTVNTGPSFTQHPSMQTVCSGQNAMFTIATDITAGVSYQWRRNGSDLSGANGSTYTVVGAVPGDAGSYDCVASSLCGSATSLPASLVVNTAPSITQEPSNVSACTGAMASLVVAADGSPSPTFQWRREGVEIGGATSAMLTINPVVAGSAGSYDCVVTNLCGSTTSQTGVLSVGTLAAFTQHPAALSVCAGSEAMFSVAVEPAAGVTFQWRRNSVDLPGQTAAVLALAGVTPANAGSYDCIATNACGSVASDAATLAVDVGPSVTNEPVNADACVGASASFMVAVTPAASAAYQWRHGGVEVPGATAATLTITPVSTADAGVYDCVITNPCGSATSASASLTVTPAPSINSQPGAQSACVGGSASFAVGALPAGVSYQWRRDGSPVPGATANMLVIDPVGAGDAGSYDCVVTGACGSATSDAAGLSVGVPPAFTTHPAPASACAGSEVSLTVATTPAAGVSYQWRRGGAPIGGATTPTLTFNPVSAADAGSYDCVATSICGSATSDAATLSVASGPTIQDQPSSQSVTSGASASFAVSLAGSTGAPGYQWMLAGSPITDGPAPGGGVFSGTATNLLSILGAGPGDAGNYSVLITDACGSVASNSATLTVNPPSGCVSDFNQDGNVDPDDLADFITCFFTQVQIPGLCPEADFNLDGNIDPDDLADFVTAFFTPC